MRFYIPVGVDVLLVVLLVAAHFDLLETPLRQDSVGSFQVASRLFMPEPHPRCQSVDLAVFRVPPGSVGIVDDLDFPDVILVSDSVVAVSRHFPILLCDRSGDGVRMEVSTSRGVDETKLIPIEQISNGSIRVDGWLTPCRRDKPIVVLVFVVVAGYLLLEGSDGQTLHVRVQQSSTVAVVLERELGSISDLQR